MTTAIATTNSAQALPADAAPGHSHALQDIEQSMSPNPVASHCLPASATPTTASKMSATVKWFANLSALGGGAAMAGFPILSLSPYAYVPFFVSHVIWSVVAWRQKEKELMYLNLGALGLDVWAIIMRVI